MWFSYFAFLFSLAMASGAFAQMTSNNCSRLAPCFTIGGALACLLLFVDAYFSAIGLLGGISMAVAFACGVVAGMIGFQLLGLAELCLAKLNEHC